MTLFSRFVNEIIVELQYKWDARDWIKIATSFVCLCVASKTMKYNHSKSKFFTWTSCSFCNRETVGFLNAVRIIKLKIAAFRTCFKDSIQSTKDANISIRIEIILSRQVLLNLNKIVHFICQHSQSLSFFNTNWETHSRWIWKTFYLIWKRGNIHSFHCACFKYRYAFYAHSTQKEAEFDLQRSFKLHILNH